MLDYGDFFVSTFTLYQCLIATVVAVKISSKTIYSALMASIDKAFSPTGTKTFLTIEVNGT